MPKSNGKWWAEKLQANVERDRRKDRDLKELGWTVIHVWEHEEPTIAAERIENAWSAALARSGPQPLE